MSIEMAAFYAISAVTLVSAAMVVKSRNPFHSGLWLALSLFSVGGHYLLLRAPYLAAVQVLTYVGAVAILIIFVVMLTRREKPV